MLKEKNIIGSLVFFFVGMFAVFEGWRINPGTFSNPGAGFFAFSLGIVLSILSILLFYKGIRSRFAETKNPIEISGRWKRLIFGVALFVSYAFALKSLGFIICSFILLILLFRMVEGRSWRSTLLISIICTVVSYLVFAKYLGVPLPKGIIPY